VHVGRDDAALDRKPGGSPQHQILADASDQLGQLLGHRTTAAGILRPLERLDIAIAGNGEPGDGAHERLKQFVPRDEVGFGIDLDQSAREIARCGPDQTLGGDPPGLFRRRRQALFAQPVDRGLDLAGGFAERPLAIHHPGAGLVAQFLDQGSGYLRHSDVLSSVRLPRRTSRAADAFVARKISAAGNTVARALLRRGYSFRFRRLRLTGLGQID
jgi:hypothetical protein